MGRTLSVNGKCPGPSQSQLSQRRKRSTLHLTPDPNRKRLVQTFVTSYLTPVKMLRSVDSSPGTPKMCRRKLTLVHTAVTPKSGNAKERLLPQKRKLAASLSDSDDEDLSKFSSQDLAVNIPKRSLAAPYSDDDDDFFSPDKETRSLRQGFLTPPKSPEICTLVMLKANTPKRKLRVPLSDDEEGDLGNNNNNNNNNKIDQSTSTSELSWNDFNKRQAKLFKPSCRDSPSTWYVYNNQGEGSPKFLLKKQANPVPSNPKQVQTKSPPPNKTPTTNKITVLNSVILTPPVSLNNIKIKSKDENNKLKYTAVDILGDFFKTLNTSPQYNYLKCLLSKDEVNFLRTIFDMAIKEYKYAILELFIHFRKWVNVHKYVQEIGLTHLTASEISQMHKYFQHFGLVNTDYLGEDVSTLLHLLSLKDIRSIYSESKLPGLSGLSKDLIISKLLTFCSHDNDLEYVKSPVQMLKDLVTKKLGICMKLTDQSFKALYKLYLLESFARNGRVAPPSEYFARFDDRISFPEYEVETYLVFYTDPEFTRYAEAMLFRMQLDDAFKDKNYPKILSISDTAYRKLSELLTDPKPHKDRPSFLEKFTTESVYITILTQCIKSKHFSESSDKLLQWLKLLTSQRYFCSNQRALWVYQLCLIYSKELKRHEKAAEILVRELQSHGSDFSHLQMQEFLTLGDILRRKSYNLPQLFQDEIVHLLPLPCEPEFTTCTISVGTKKTRGRQKKIDVENNRIENRALEHYRKDYAMGDHFGISIVRALFCLFFWDIIYDSHVKGTFVSPNQSVPLDMYTPHFYQNRRDAILTRVEQIQVTWSLDEYKDWAMRIWSTHSHEESLCRVECLITSKDMLHRILGCFSRHVLGAILKRLALNFEEYQEDFPDLTLWDFDTKDYKFVTVIGDKDKLSVNKKLWLAYLIEAGANVEVCHIKSSSGSEPKTAKKNKCHDEE